MKIFQNSRRYGELETEVAPKDFVTDERDIIGATN